MSSMVHIDAAINENTRLIWVDAYQSDDECN